MDPSSLAAKFAEDLAEISWSDIQPHAKRDAVIVIDDALNMVDVGIAIANDQVTQVQHWIDEALVQKPSVEQLTLWNTDPSRLFEALIVQPYVLISDRVNNSVDSDGF